MPAWLGGKTAFLAGAALVFVGGAWMGWSARGWGAKSTATAALAKADQIDAGAAAALQQGVQHAANAKAQDQAIEATHSAVAADRARLQMDQAARAARPVRPAGAAPEPTGATLDLVVDRDKDQLITGLTQEVVLLRAQRVDLQAANAALTAAGTGFQQSGQAYRDVAVKASLPEHPWAVGAIYGTSQTWGAFVERDLGPFRAGLDVVRRVLPTGNATIDTTARLGWRFSWGR